MTAQAPVLRKHGNAYNIFILVLTIFSLVIMVLLLLPVTPAERDLLTLYDNVVCVIFLIDFAMNLAGARPKRAYFIGAARLARPARVDPELRLHPVHRALPPRPPQPADPDHPPAARPGRQGPRPGRAQEPRPVRDVHHDPAGRDRAQSIASILVLEVESRAPDAQHHDRRRCHLVGHRDDHDGRLRRLLPGDDARAPHRVFVMFAGIGIIGALASILASLLVSPRADRRARAGRGVQVPTPAAGADGDDRHDRRGAGGPSGRDRRPARRDRRAASVSRHRRDLSAPDPATCPGSRTRRACGCRRCRRPTFRCRPGPRRS